jgi:hypothetical protein
LTWFLLAEKANSAFLQCHFWQVHSIGLLFLFLFGRLWFLSFFCFFSFSFSFSLRVRTLIWSLLAEKVYVICNSISHWTRFSPTFIGYNALVNYSSVYRLLFDCLCLWIFNCFKGPNQGLSASSRT